MSTKTARPATDKQLSYLLALLEQREVEPAPEVSGSIGIDWGVSTTATTTDPAYDLPHVGHRKRSATELAKAQRKMARRARPRGHAQSKGYQRAKRESDAQAMGIMVGSPRPWCTRGGIHLYAMGDEPEKRGYVERWVSTQEEHNWPDGTPCDFSETGYFTALQSTESFPVSEAAQAIYEPRKFLHYWRVAPAGSRIFTYGYVHLGTSLTNKQHRFGWIRNDGSFTPAYHAMKTFLAIFNDVGATFTPGRLRFAIAAGPTDLQPRVLFQRRRDGGYTFLLPLVRGVSVWQKNAPPSLPRGRDLTPDAADVRVTFGPLVDVRVWSPSERTTPTAWRTGVTSHTEPVAGPMKILEIRVP